MHPDFQPVFDALKKILKKYERGLAVARDTPEEYSLETKTKAFRGRPLYFAGVKAGKAYVSYHLVPVYMSPELAKLVSPALKKRMQGKACFNFKAVDRELFKELGVLTTKSLKHFKDFLAKPTA